MRELLEQSRPLLQAPFFQFLENLEATTREQGEPETAEQLVKIRALALQYTPQPAAQSAVPEQEPPSPREAPPEESPDSETRTPSGLIIAKR